MRFPICNGLALGKPHERTESVGSCPVHSYSCPICGFGVGCAPLCCCPESADYSAKNCHPFLRKSEEAGFGSHIHEAIHAVSGKPLIREEPQ